MDVSRETLMDLEAYADEILKWNPKINLISRSTVANIWQRHIEDSVQVFFPDQKTRKWVDIGSGAGLPGLVVAILAKTESPKTQVTLIESDQRKGAFCRSVIRKLDLNAKVLSERIESAPSQGADIVSARALAPLSSLMSYANLHLKTDGFAIFQKGAGWEAEVEEALANWRFTVEKRPSRTESAAVILTIGDIIRV